MSRYTTHPRGRKPQPGPLDLLSVAQQVAATTAIVPTGDLVVVDAEPVLDRRGRRRSAANMPGAHRGVSPANKGLVCC